MQKKKCILIVMQKKLSIDIDSFCYTTLIYADFN